MNFNMSCIKRAQGNQREADYLMDCSWFEYYYRIVVSNNYAHEIEEEIKKSKAK